MQRKDLIFVIPMTLFLIGLSASSFHAFNKQFHFTNAKDLPKNENHMSIRENGVSYELYLPEDYSENKTYPLIICLSPGGNGKDFEESVYPAANENGFILVGSNDYKNMRWASYFLPRVYRTAEDVKTQVKINTSEVYLCGFSGGGMAAYSVAHQIPGYFKGLIINSGAMHPIVYTEDGISQMGVEKAVLMCGKWDTLDTCDMIRSNAKDLEEAGINVTVIEYYAEHRIASADRYREAFEWILSS